MNKIMFACSVMMFGMRSAAIAARDTTTTYYVESRSDMIIQIDREAERKECPLLKPSVLFFGLSHFLVETKGVSLAVPGLVSLSAVWTLFHRLFTKEHVDARWLLRTFGSYLFSAASGYGLRCLIDRYSGARREAMIAALLLSSCSMIYFGCSDPKDQADEPCCPCT